MTIINFDAGHVDPTDVTDLSRARRRGLRHYWRERFEPAIRLTYLAPLIGLRNSRQIVGEYQITLRDQIVRRQFPDCVGYVRSHYDNHASDYENESDEAMAWVWLLGNWQTPIGSEIPYRALLPQDVDGLLLGCRALSLTHDAHNQFRMQRDIQRVGEVAGIAAALAVRQRTTPRAIDTAALQTELRAVGAIVAPGQPSPLTVPAIPAPQPAADVLTQLDAPQPTAALTTLLAAGDAARTTLRAGLESAQPQARFWSAVALALLDDPAGAPELMAAVRERRATVPAGIKTVPLWMPCAVLLGRTRDPRAVPVLTELLRDPAVPLDGLVAAVRALGRIGDRAAVPALQALRRRTDVPTERTFQRSMGFAGPVVEDARWQLELAVAEVLAGLGAPAPEIAARWQSDSRALVRRYARQVAGVRPTAPEKLLG